MYIIIRRIFIYLLTEKIYFKPQNGSVNFQIQFCLGGISNRFCASQSREVSLRGNVSDFPVDYDVVFKPDILNISKYLMDNI